jgi:hypothetical protein
MRSRRGAGSLAVGIGTLVTHISANPGADDCADRDAHDRAGNGTCGRANRRGLLFPVIGFASWVLVADGSFVVLVVSPA